MILKNPQLITSNFFAFQQDKLFLCIQDKGEFVDRAPVSLGCADWAVTREVGPDSQGLKITEEKALPL